MSAFHQAEPLLLLPLLHPSSLRSCCLFLTAGCKAKTTDPSRASSLGVCASSSVWSYLLGWEVLSCLNCSPIPPAVVKGKMNAENPCGIFAITNDTSVWEPFGSGGSSLLQSSSFLEAFAQEGTSGDFQSVVEMTLPSKLLAFPEYVQRVVTYAEATALPFMFGNWGRRLEIARAVPCPGK